MNSKIEMCEEGIENIYMVKKILEDATKEKGLYLNYVNICYCATILREKNLMNKNQLPVNIKAIYQKWGVCIREENLNSFMKGTDFKKVNQIIGKISIRPDLFSGETKVTVYIEENESPAMVNYALAHELCHLIINYTKENSRYSDDYCTMPMLPKIADELIADAFAVFLLIPFDMFLKIFKDYVNDSQKKGNIPIRTKEWLNHLSAAVAVPYDYVACAYQQIRHIAYVMYVIHTAKSEEDKKTLYGEYGYALYNLIKDEIDEELLQNLFQ